MSWGGLVGGSTKERDVELVLQRALEAYPEAKGRVISDNGPQFIGNDFSSFVRLAGLTHVRISAYWPHFNRKLERWNATMKTEAIRMFQPQTVEDARQVVKRFVEHYNAKRLHSGIGYVAPLDMLNGRAEAIWADRDRKLEEARERRKQQRAEAKRFPSEDQSAAA